MEGFAVMILMIVLIVRTIKKHKKSIKVSQEKYRPQAQNTAPPMDEGMSAYPPQAAPKQQPVQQKIDLDAPTHRHVEHVSVQAGAFAGEGDADRYNIREVSCETIGHKTQAPQYDLPTFDRENMVSAIIMSEVLGKPKALRK